jgi:8-oxo-dGTP diphosphatase
VPRASRPLRGKVTVVAAVLTRGDGRVLVQERPSTKPAAGRWEFPGGKVDAGETPEAALARELREELGIALLDVPRWETALAIRPDAARRSGSRLLWTRGARWSGEPEACEGQALAWLEPAEILRVPLLAADLPIVARLLLPPRLAITPPEGGAPERLEQRAETLLSREGAGGLLVRLPGVDPDARLEIAGRLRRLCARRGAVFLFHGSEDLALRLDAAGVQHTSAALARRRLGSASGLLHGVSVHDREEIARALTRGAHYLLLGPVRRTASHPERSPLGWEAFAALVSGLPVPVYALGGLGFDDLERAQAAGAHGVAVLGGCRWS